MDQSGRRQPAWSGPDGRRRYESPMTRTKTSVLGALVALALVGSMGTVGAVHTTSHDAAVTTRSGTVNVPAIQQTNAAVQSPPGSAADAVTAPSDAVRDAHAVLTDVQDSRLVSPVTASPLTLVPPVAYSRYDSSDPLAHDTRQAIYETVTDSPGTHLSAIAAVTDVPTSTVRYHVRILAYEDVVETDRTRGKRRVFPAQSEREAVAAALSDDSTAPLLHALRRAEPVGVSGLAERVGLAASTVSYHLSRLEDADLVERDRDGMTVSVTLTAAARQAIPE